MTANLRRTALRGGVAGLTSAVAVAATVVGAAAYYARKVVTPDDGPRPDDVEVLAVGPGTVTLRATEESVAPGRYGLWLARGDGHARVGEVLDHDEAARTVTRRLLGVDHGHMHVGPARWNQYFHTGTPATGVGLPFRDVEVVGEVGPLPCWVVPAADSTPAEGARRWAVLVHGRGATREECLRALPVLHRLGFTSLVMSYRNDPGAARSPAGRYHLGDREWLDVEAGLGYAVEHGADEVALVGWSMGGAIALQTVARSRLGDRVRAVVLDAPVLDWRDVLTHHARLNRLPGPVARLSQAVLAHRTAWRLAGIEAPVDLDALDWVAKAAELTVPVLLIHSEDDEFVPAGPSQRLAQARPDIVTLVPSRGARHTKEWNVDPEGWDAAVARFLLDH